MQIPLWKRIFVWGLCALGILLAAPNLFYSRVERHNDSVARIEKVGATPELEADRAAWPSWAPSSIVPLGLDLRGGAHLLAEVQVKDVYKSRMNGFWPEIRKALVAERAVVGGVRRVPGPDDELRVQIEKPDGLEKAMEVARGLTSPIISLTGAGQRDFDISGQGNVITIALSSAEKAATDDRTIQQSLEIIRRRVDEVGTREPTIQREGSNRILIQVPGIGSAEELKALIGTTAKLTFQPVVSRTTDANAIAGPGNQLLPAQDEPGVYYVLEDAPVVTGENLVDAKPEFDQNGAPAVGFRFDTSGGRKFGDYTANNVGKLFAIVLDGKVISAPRIQTAISGGSGIITGNFTVESSTNLAVLLRAGALPAGMVFLEQRTIGPELGQDSIDAGLLAASVGYAAVALFMIASYGFFGFMAVIALAINVAFIFAVLSIIGATLTLPGIAGIVLTMGMAVDANVLIYERIREELRRGHGPARAIEIGYEKAMSAIIDSNVTALISNAILFFIGSGPVKGFAVTLTIGVITSVFSAVFVTRLLVVTWFERRRPKTIVV